MPELPPYRRVLALIRFDALDGMAAKRALMLARLNGAALDFLHLVEPDGLLEGGYPCSSTRADARELEAAAVRRLAFLAASVGATEARCHAAYGPLRQGFEHHVAHWKPDLLVTAEPVAWAEGVCDVLVLSPAGPRRRGRLMSGILGLLGSLAGAAGART